jgi:hypothetical protein
LKFYIFYVNDLKIGETNQPLEARAWESSTDSTCPLIVDVNMIGDEGQVIVQLNLTTILVITLYAERNKTHFGYRLMKIDKPIDRKTEGPYVPFFGYSWSSCQNVKINVIHLQSDEDDLLTRFTKLFEPLTIADAIENCSGIFVENYLLNDKRYQIVHYPF